MKDRHFKYFLALDQDFAATFRYVEPDKQNFKTFSVEYLRLLLASCSEVEVVCKQLCGTLEPDKDVSHYDFPQLAGRLARAFPRMADTKITVLALGQDLQPLQGLGKRRTDRDGNKHPNLPGWWTAYNLAKHSRDKNFERANFKNVLSSIAALFVLLMYWYRQESKDDTIQPPGYPTILFYRGWDGPLHIRLNRISLPDFPATSS